MIGYDFNPSNLLTRILLGGSSLSKICLLKKILMARKFYFHEDTPRKNDKINKNLYVPLFLEQECALSRKILGGTLGQNGWNQAQTYTFHCVAKMNTFLAKIMVGTLGKNWYNQTKAYMVPFFGSKNEDCLGTFLSHQRKPTINH